MKKILMAAVLTAVFSLAVAADDFNPPVLVDAMEFRVETDGNNLVFNWRPYLRDDFQWYKLVRSKRNPNPVYPQDDAIFVGEDFEDTYFSYRQRESDTFYYRLTIVTKNGDRWISPVFRFTPSESGPASPPGPGDFGSN